MAISKGLVQRISMRFSMKVGDFVSREEDESRTWKVINARSDSRAFWIQLDEPRYEHDVWHDARYFKVVHEAG